MNIYLLLVALLSAAVGALLAWLRGSRSGQFRGGMVQALEARCGEIEKQRTALQKEIETARTEIRGLEKMNAGLQERVQASEKNLAEQRALLDESKTKLTDVFKALASDALKSNSNSFLDLAKTKLDGATVAVTEKESSIQRIADEIREVVTKYHDKVEALEGERIQQFARLNTQLDGLKDAEGALQTETSKLVNALRSPQVRGRWGEITLQRTAELAGMTLHCDFVQQESIATENGLLRPDMVVKLPANREIVVDSKVPLSAYLEVLEASGPVERERALQKHVTQTKQHIKQLASKQYASQFVHAPEFVVMFIPNDSFLSAAAEKEPTLIEDALKENVVIATPSTFIALLRAVAFGWAQQELAANARKIGELGEELHERLVGYLGHVNKVGNALDSAVKAFNESVGSLESRVLSSARKLKEFDSNIQQELPLLEVVERASRSLSAKIGD